MVCVKKNATICKICALLFDKKSCHTFMVCLWIFAGSAGIQIVALFAKGAALSRHKVLYKTAHCGTAINMWRCWWEKSGEHAVMFSSAAAARLLHSF